MADPKVLVLSVQLAYAFCQIDGKTHTERLDSPMTKEQVKTKILARLKAEAEKAQKADAATAPTAGPTTESDTLPNNKSKK